MYPHVEHAFVPKYDDANAVEGVQDKAYSLEMGNTRQCCPLSSSSHRELSIIVVGMADEGRLCFRQYEVRCSYAPLALA